MNRKSFHAGIFAGITALRKFINSWSIGIFLVMLIILIFTSVNASQHDEKSLLNIVQGYANAMIENGRDTYGEEQSPLFAAALDRSNMGIGSVEKFGSIPGVREGDRSIGGSNPQEDYSLYAILYDLTQITGDKSYAQEADKALEFFFKRTQSPETGLMAWGEHLHWDMQQDTIGGRDIHEIKGKWAFWDQSYRLAPEASWRHVIGLWDHQIANKKTGNFSRHTRWSKHDPDKGFEFPRYAGQMILDWAIAYDRKENAQRERRDDLLKAISVVAGRIEDNMALTNSGYLPAGRAEEGDHINVTWMPNNLELARTLWKAKRYLREADKDLARRLENLALEQDYGFLKAPHKITTGGGFASSLHTDTGEPRTREMNKPYTAVWATGYGQGTHAALANLCFKRYKQLKEKHPELAEKYRVYILAAANQYLSQNPDLDQVQKPRAFSNVIELMLNAYNLMQEKRFINRADYFSRTSIALFLNDDLPLPKATNQHSHYEAITGGPELMHTLLKLHVVKLYQQYW